MATAARILPHWRQAVTADRDAPIV